MSSSNDPHEKADSPLDATQLAAREQFSRQSQRYGKGHILENVTDVEEALGSCSLPLRAKVLDVACGAGHTGLHLASLGHEVTCADLSPAMLDRAREGSAARNLTIDTKQHAAESMPYPDDSFDLVTCRVAPHHFSSPSQFVREVARVLREGGWFLLIDGTIPDNEPEAGEWLNRVEKFRDPSHVRLIAPSEWCHYCADAGLQVERRWLRRKKQPDLNWYFETAATSAENRKEVLALIESASPRIRETYNLAEEDGKIVWQWPMLSLLARK
jgi:ubiquinone/menaquinone biosynthesis C-methylase UbiE